MHRLNRMRVRLLGMHRRNGMVRLRWMRLAGVQTGLAWLIHGGSKKNRPPT